MSGHPSPLLVFKDEKVFRQRIEVVLFYVNIPPTGGAIYCNKDKKLNIRFTFGS